MGVKLKEYKLVRISSLTRGVLNKNGEYAYDMSLENEIYYFFNSLSDAQEFIDKDKIGKNNITYLVYSSNEELVFEDYSGFKPIEMPNKSKKWWIFWKDK